MLTHNSLVSAEIDEANTTAISDLRGDDSRSSIRVTGTVTYADPRWNLLFVQDESRGIYVHNNIGIAIPRFGDQVELMGDYESKCVMLQSLQRFGSAGVPTPINANDTTIPALSLDAQWVEFRGIVQHAEFTDEHFMLLIGNSYQDVTVFTPDLNLTNQPSDWGGKRVAIQGVWKQYRKLSNDRARAELLVPQLKYIRVEADTSEPTLSSSYRDSAFENQHIRVKGVVSHQHSPKRLYVASKEQQVEVILQKDMTIAVGQPVVASGYLRLLGGYSRLEHSNVEVLNQEIQPVPTSKKEDLANANHGELLESIGTLIASDNATDARLVLRRGSDLILAHHPVPLPSIPPRGAEIAITGIYVKSSLRGDHAHELLIRSPDDVVVLNSPPQTQAPNRWPFVVTLIAVAALIVGGLAYTRRSPSSDLEKIEHRLSELAHANRLSSLGEMVNGIAHELNQPLSAICNYVHVCKRLVHNDKRTCQPKLEDALESIQRQTVRVGNTIHRLRGLTKKTEPVRVSADLNLLANEAAGVCRDAREGDTSFIKFDLDPSLPPVQVDDVQIQQVMINLIRNAIEATEDRSSPSVEVSSTLRSDQRIEIAIADNGSGLPTDNPRDVFEPNFTTKEEGIGIGLCISETIVKMHGGDLTAESNRQGGATFRIRLPIENERSYV